MGQRYEKSKKNVSDNKQTLERLRSDKDILQNEYSPLSILDSIRELLDDEATDAIRQVELVGESESQRLESGTDTAEKEKKQIAGEIDNEIAKLNAGLEKLRQANGLEFGKKSIEQSEREYEKQISSFKSLIEELGDKHSEKTSHIPENQQYTLDTMAALEAELQDSFDKETILAGSAGRNMNAPSTVAPNGTVKGEWRGDIFYFDEAFIPSEKYNPDGKTMGEIKEILSDKYGISFDGIPYHNGVADFSSISVANISTSDIAIAASGKDRNSYESLNQRERLELFQKVFSDTADGKPKRNTNFHIADSIVAERQIPIPGLPVPYTATELRKWRTENHFTWDEQLSGGYNLVPSVIHGNLSHTGLVSTAGNASPEIIRIDREQREHPELFSWDEQTAPISIEEYLNQMNK